MIQRDVANLTQIRDFDEVIDVRSPAEFAEDHLPGAISCPVLSNEERARVGTLYKQESPFAAKKVGAALIARNIAAHLEERFLDKPRNWRPLVYCWRGGQRSGAFTHILRQIGWDARRLDGGYKSWRRHVLAELATLPPALSWRVISGSTGSGKSRLLEALAAEGAQVLHLEELAAHKGSLLGILPDTPQPSQKMFETRIYQVLSGFDCRRPVFIEAESRRIGNLQLPDALHLAIRSAPLVQMEAGLDARIEFLLRDYDYFLADPAALIARLDYFRGVQSRETIAAWQALAQSGEWRLLVSELIEHHYDPLYQRSQSRRSPAAAGETLLLRCDDLTPAGIARCARELLARTSV